MIRKVVLFLLLILGTSIFSITTFTYRSPESVNDPRFDYYNELLKLALDKTVESDGKYILTPSPVMNFKRMEDYLERNVLENFIVVLSATDIRNENFDHINFPVDLGILGYRAFIVSDRAVDRVKDIENIEDLKEFDIIQGVGWSDISIYNNAGIAVREIAKYESLFIEISKNRSDIFPRGINEILPELESHDSLSGLNFSKDVLIYYPYPRFFYTSLGNKEALERVERGLKIAYNDGSLLKLWKEYYWGSIELFTKNDSRVIKLENPYIKNIDESYKDYFYNFK